MKVVDSIDKPADIVEFRTILFSDRDRFTRRMLAAGSFVIDNPHEVALSPISALAERSGLPATNFVRLAQAMGFSGFSEMQRLFRDPLHRSFHPTLEERIRHSQGEQVISDPNDISALGRSLAQANIASLNHLSDRIASLPLEAAVDRILDARVVYVVGVDRSFAPAAYLSYALNRAGVQSVQITGSGSAARDHAAVMAPDDLLVAISFPPYAQDTITACGLARRNDRPIIAITDGNVSPIADGALEVIAVEDAELHGFRALTVLMTVVQTLMMGVAYRKRQAHGGFNIDEINA
ncbi:MurR/RpiR family transcriptional regulator [Paracoccus liaowanqingii]|uniref:MurR/RpiR family transcriptional regulator n=1 Tax=Paracoccus liaowanqingii TaxID=2560053 RepID=A0A4Z1CSF1_9RHOB|nr:MurR/RpiR family transcriptional regulator [Paracoccus liaowanqingii]TGN68177.1 MurR/RpiR family transcriptional regulator [Paracoccus liaowanqingii]